MWLALTLGVCLWPATWLPQQPAQDDQDSEDEIEYATATRLDLSLCLLDLERAVRSFDSAEPTGEAKDQTAERIAQVIDRATLAFFLGDGRRALRSMRGLEESLGTPDAATRLAHTLCVRVQPAVGLSAMDSAATLGWTQFYAPQPEVAEQRFEFVLLGPQPATTVVARLKVSGAELSRAGSAVWPATDALAAGRYDIRLGACSLGHWNVLAKSPAVLRQGLLARLDAITPTANLAAALCSARARAGLLVDTPNPGRSAEFQADLAQIAEQVEGEVAALEAARDPYRRRPGDVWRALPKGSSTLPFRLFAPVSACGDEAHPLVIALHGAGGDENMFFDAYDLGRLRELAEARSFLLVSPQNVFFGDAGRRSMLELIEWVSGEYAVDPARIYLLGHSMGAGAAAALAGPLRDRLAGVVCLAGGVFTKSAGCAPILAIAAGADGVLGWKAIESSAAGARTAGAAIEFRLLEHLGHLTMVGPALPAAVDWMLSRKLQR